MWLRKMHVKKSWPLIMQGTLKIQWLNSPNRFLLVSARNYRLCHCPLIFIPLKLLTVLSLLLSVRTGFYYFQRHFLCTVQILSFKLLYSYLLSLCCKYVPQIHFTWQNNTKKSNFNNWKLRRKENHFLVEKNVLLTTLVNMMG